MAFVKSTAEPKRLSSGTRALAQAVPATRMIFATTRFPIRGNRNNVFPFGPCGDIAILNLLALAAMIGLGINYHLPSNYYVLLGIGSFLAMVAGFASFSQGSLFRRGRAKIVTGTCTYAIVGLAIAVGWIHGLWWGIGAFVLFWPIMYRLGVKFLIWIPEPPPRRFRRSSNLD